MIDLYKFSFVVLTGANLALGYLQWRSANMPEKVTQVEGDEKGAPEQPVVNKKAIFEFQRTFFSVYVFVVAADWLQGPYMYTLYKDEKELSERMVAMLFASGFVSAAISASFVGAWADQYGRRLACLWFCVAYALSCLSMRSNSGPILFLGRLLGGLSTTLMYSVFETWMVHEYHAQDMNTKGLALSRVFGMMTTCSSIVAIVAGVCGEILVDRTETKVAPFMAALVCLSLAFGLIVYTWPENYGATVQSSDAGIGGGSDITTIIKDKRIVSLGLICCLFEGTMYLFVFFWSAALKSARAATGNTTSPPFGLVFATFMNAMMFGSQLFTVSGYTLTLSSSIHSLGLNILLAAASLLAITSCNLESITLWAFCLFEACVGLYYPSMGYLKGQIVRDGVRAKVYSMLRLPLNLFVVFTLSLTREGDRHRNSIFVACSGLLVIAYLVLHKYLAQ